MGNDGIGAPLSRRVPGEARTGPGQPVRPVLPESVLHRMQAAIDAEHAHEEGRPQGEPNTEPLPAVPASVSPGKRGAKRAPSPSGLGPDFEPVPEPAAKPAGIARPLRAAKSPRAEEPLRVAKALGATEALRAAEEMQAASAARVRATEPARAPVAEAPLPVEAPLPAEPAYVPPPPSAAEPTSAARRSVTSAFETGPAPGSIGWLWPEETTGGRAGGGPRWQPPRRWRYRTATLVAVGAVVLAGAGLYIGESLHSTPVVGAGHGKSSPKATAPAGKATATPAATPTTPAYSAAPDPGIAGSLAAAAVWVNQQVAPGTSVACDVQTCAVLAAGGLPVAQQVQVGLSSQSLSNASIVVVTPGLRTLFSTLNPSLGNEVVPVVLANFGPVSIQVVYPAGRAAYQAALSQDVQARIQVGQQLLNSGRVTASPGAEGELNAGDVDPRLLLAIQALANQQSVDIVDFGGSGAGGGPGAPFRGVQLAETDLSGGMAPSVYVQSMIALLQAHATFPAFASGKQVTLADGQTVVQVVYAAPTPLGLLAP
jgi:hypothetical protein